MKIKLDKNWHIKQSDVAKVIKTIRKYIYDADGFNADNRIIADVYTHDGRFDGYVMLLFRTADKLILVTYDSGGYADTIAKSTTPKPDARFWDSLKDLEECPSWT